MALPKKRHTKSGRNQRRSHHALKKLNLTSCAKCNEAILPHRVCPKCGTYAGREIIEIQDKKNKKEKKKAKDNKKKEIKKEGKKDKK